VARFDLEVEPQTLAAMRGLRDGLAGLSCERVAGELVKLLMSSRRPSKGLRLLHEIGALAHVLPELLPSVGFAQNNPHHHLDVWQHVLLAVDTAAARGSGIAVRLAALLHDVAKPECYSEDTRPDGSVLGHFLGHELRSAEIADEILTRLRLRSVDGVPQDVPARVCRMVLHHLVAIDSGASERALRRFIHRVGGRQAALELLELWAADRSAHADGLDETEYERMVQRVAGAGDVPLSAHRLALGGGALATRFGLSGPAIGALKERLLEAVVAGDVENDEAALLRLAERLRGSVE